MKVAFTLIGGKGWTGGFNYLENLLSALWELPDRPVEAVLFIGRDVDPGLVERLIPYLCKPPIRSATWDSRASTRSLRTFCSFLLQRDYLAEMEFRREGIQIVFQHQAWYGFFFKIPTLAWIADFQHRRLPAMFSKTRFLWRDFGYKALSYSAGHILVSSIDAKKDCERYYPHSRGRISALPFAVNSPSGGHSSSPDLLALYKLPKRFFYLPNQLWAHKNHTGLIEALRLIKRAHDDVFVVASGSPVDVRHPKYPSHVLSLVGEYELDDVFRYLGFIPSDHIFPLMGLSLAVINPSFFEGWSTTVEEAKAIGAPLLLSNIPIHIEQAADTARYFDPSDPVDIARVLVESWNHLQSPPTVVDKTVALERNQSRRLCFAHNFTKICFNMLGHSTSHLTSYVNE